MKVLMVAPTCNPREVGEAWVGYQWARRLSERHELTLLTYRKRDWQPLAPELPRARVVEWVEPAGFGRFERLNSLLKPGYVAFHRRCRAWLEGADLAAYDVGFQPVPVGMRFPSPLSGSSLPFVFGPVGGGLPDPPGFGAEDTAPFYVRLRAIDAWRLRHDPVLRRTYTDAACVVGIAEYVRERLVGVPVQRFEIMSETAIESVPEPVDRSQRDGLPLRLLFVGRVIRTKGVRDAIRAVALLPDVPLVFDVVGDGFDLERCAELVRELGQHDRVVLHGRLPRDEIDAFYRAADVFLFPSYREPGGNVPYEAMGFGLPVVTSDRGGPASAVNDSCGITVTPESPERYPAALAAAVRRLVDDPALRARLSSGARVRVQASGTWDARVAAMEELFRDVAAQRGAS